MSQQTLAKAEIEAKIIEVLEEMTVDWDLDLKIGSDTRLIEDLMFESIDIVRFVVALEQALNVKGLPFEKLFMHDGDYVEEILVSQAVEFLENNLS
ncbi:Acyl carrier protein [Tumidithrix helvetica PCC 7403]|uniref:acyl carrier protein n=1 Tax=Tumidithrix helvetica TaxID=3457545 RepID=UPI003C9468AD